MSLHLLFLRSSWINFLNLNSRVYVRGHALDYDRWATEGATGWTYSECLPYYKKAQTHELVSYISGLCCSKAAVRIMEMRNHLICFS